MGQGPVGVDRVALYNSVILGPECARHVSSACSSFLCTCGPGPVGLQAFFARRQLLHQLLQEETTHASSQRRLAYQYQSTAIVCRGALLCYCRGCAWAPVRLGEDTYNHTWGHSLLGAVAGIGTGDPMGILWRCGHIHRGGASGSEDNRVTRVNGSLQ